MSIQMSANNPGNSYSITLPPPSGAVVPVVNGVATVQPEDVRLAMQQGLQVGPTENWPGAELVRMKAPQGAAWPSNGTIATPDGASVTVTGGVAKMPVQFVQAYIGYGWSRI
jgi:hypothetical protein